MKKCLVALLFFLANLSSSVGQPLHAVSEKGKGLRNFFLSLNVENHWTAGHHINWETGEADGITDAKHKIKTHCSAFVAAACKQKGIYILRPPAHTQVLLANAQFDWLGSDSAYTIGWHRITGKETFSRYFLAQDYANSGKIVVAVWKNEDPRRPGHIAFVMPVEISDEVMVNEGPRCISAGRVNASNISLIECFKNHINEWPEPSIQFYYYDKLN